MVICQFAKMSSKCYFCPQNDIEMDKTFTWVPFYKELAQGLLRYKDNRRTLVDWIYSDLGKITRDDGRPLVDYLHQKDGSRIVDIDPFSVYGIFNRGIKWTNRTDLLKKFKEHFGLASDVPTDFDGIPVLDSRRAFFFSWGDENEVIIRAQWDLFEKVVKGQDCEQEFNRVIDNRMARYSLTMVLFWIAPDRFLSLDSRNRGYLETFGYQPDYPELHYEQYKAVMDKVQNDMNVGKLPVKTFTDLSYTAWVASTETPCVWMWYGDEKMFAETSLKAGSTGKGLDYPSFKTKDELGNAYREKVGNTDVKIPYMYWDMIHNMKIGDIVVVFSSHKEKGRKAFHKLYGWGRVTSDCYFKMEEENPIRRNIEWYYPQPSKPVIEDRTKNTMYIHKIEGLDADNIIRLLGISNDKATRPSKQEVRSFWLAGYAWGSIDSQMERFRKEGIWAGAGSKAVNRKIEQLKTGDILVLKATWTKGKNHRTPVLKVRALAVVLSDKPVLKNGHYEVKVRYLDIPEKEFEGSSFGKYRQTIHECDNQEIIDYVTQYLNTETMFAPSKYAEYIALLKETHNLVLTGAPGTGKTYMAMEMAKEMGAETMFVQFHPSYDYTDFVEGLRPVDNGDGQIGFERKDGVFKDFCKKAIKNLIDSEKSVESLTKELSWQDQRDRFLEDAFENGVVLETVNGSKFTISEVKDHAIVIHNEQNEKTTRVLVNNDEILDLLTNEVPLNIVRDIRSHYGRKFGTQPDSYTFAIVKAVRSMKKKGPVAEANKVDSKPFVFIIDEINRGEASKIFGELFFAIDPGYRGNQNYLVQTQYQNLVPENDEFARGFYVPENVYILATMNDIDRSVESMDFAMRRRFTWKEITPDDTESMLDTLACAAEAKAAMKRLNKVIAETDGLGAAFSIGPSYFFKLAKNGGDFNRLWAMNIEPLLKEYLRGMRKSSDILEKYQKAYFDTKEQTTENPELVDED